MPITIDLFITSFTLATSSLDLGRPDVAYEAGNARFLVVWDEVFSQTDIDVNSRLVTEAGTLLDQVYIDFTSTSWRSPAVAANGLAQTFLVAAQARIGSTGLYGIRGRIRPSDGTALGPQFVIVSEADGRRSDTYKLGSIPCDSYVNSSGYMAYLPAVGNETLEGLVQFECDHLPANQNGMLIASMNTNQVPFGQGILCLGQPIHRYTQHAQNSGPLGIATVTVPLMPILPPYIDSGETWYFQYWTRELGDTTTPSNSIQITFQ